MDISRLSYKELVGLRDEIEASLETKRREEQAAARAAIADQAKKLGFSLTDLFGGKTKGRKFGPVEIKFRNPSNPSETWTGRGRMPNWMVKATKRGINRDQFKV